MAGPAPGTGLRAGAESASGSSPAGPADPPRRYAPRSLQAVLAWSAVLYFAEGLPLGLYYDFLPVYLRAHGADLAAIGLLGPLGLAWTVKFLWAPAVDRLRAHRRWMFGADCAMAVLLAALGALAPPLAAVLGLCGALAWLSATHDIACDAYTIELLAGRALGRVNGVRIALYRVGMLTAGVLLMAAEYVGWAVACLIGAAVLLANGVAALCAPAEAPAPRRDAPAPSAATARSDPLPAVLSGALAGGLTWLALRSVLDRPAWLAAAVLGVGAAVMALLLARRGGAYLAPLRALTARPGMVAVLGFALLFKAGDAAMGLMVRPFWLDSGFGLAQIGLVSVNVGLGLSVLGGLAGGYLTDRLGLLRALVWLGLVQAASNLGYAWAAWVIPPGGGVDYAGVIYAASMLESFTGGLGTAAFLALLMAVVDRRLAASEYAILSSVFALGRALAGWGGGLGAQTLGYAPFFALSAFVGLPALVLVPRLRRAIETSGRATHDAHPGGA